MTFRPTKCAFYAHSIPSNHTRRLPVFGRPDTPNALLVPLVPGMEAVVRAHLAAKPKPVKCETCKGKGKIVVTDTGDGDYVDKCPACKPAKKPAKFDPSKAKVGSIKPIPPLRERLVAALGEKNVNRLAKQLAKKPSKKGAKK